MTDQRPPTPDEIAAIRADMTFALESHRAWAEHLEAHALSGEPCEECEGKPYKLDAAHEREWVQKYERVLSAIDTLLAAVDQQAKILENPEKWMQWGDHRVLERCEQQAATIRTLELAIDDMLNADPRLENIDTVRAALAASADAQEPKR